MEIKPETLEVEVVEIEPINGGVQVFVKAWSEGTQVGFGLDGSVDIERFRIFNPPILVPDPNGDILVAVPEETLENGDVIPASSFSYREDAVEALLQVLASNLMVMKNTHDDTRIVKGKVGNTTSTFYSTSGGDGAITSGNAVWATARSGSGFSVATTQTTRNVYIDESYNIRRLYFPFDTSAIDDGDTVSSATFSAYSTSGSLNTLGASIGIIRGDQAADTALVSTDWEPVDFTRISTDITIASIISGGSAYYNWALNATGIAHVSVTGDTDIAFSIAHDIDDSAPAAAAYMTFFMAEQAGTTNDPKLVVEHAAGGGGAPTPTMMLMGLGT